MSRVMVVALDMLLFIHTTFFILFLQRINQIDLIAMWCSGFNMQKQSQIVLLKQKEALFLEKRKRSKKKKVTKKIIFAISSGI